MWFQCNLTFQLNAPLFVTWFQCNLTFQLNAPLFVSWFQCSFTFQLNAPLFVTCFQCNLTFQLNAPLFVTWFKCNLTFQLNAPLFVTWFQCVVTVLLCFILSLLSKYIPAVVQFPDLTVDPKLCRSVSKQTRPGDENSTCPLVITSAILTGRVINQVI